MKKNNRKNELIRICPECNNEIKHKNIRSWKNSINKNKLCKSCSRKQVMNNKEIREKISKSLLGHKVTRETRTKISKKQKGVKKWENGFSKEHRNKIKEKRKLQKFSEESCRKMRISAKKRIENQNGQCIPNYNPNSIKFLEQKAKELNINDLQHAENGGEFQFRGFFADGFSKEKNIWFEYMERRHEAKSKRDLKRRTEIIKHLECKFIEIWYNGTIKEYNK